MKVVAIVSGGLDSVVLAHHLHAGGDELRLLSVNYGQRHRKELEYARACAARLGVEHRVADLTALTPLLSGSALTTAEMEVPLGHYADESMKATVVPNRNALMLSVACAWAVSMGYEAVATAVHAGDHPIYPDCRSVFVQAISSALQLGNEGSGFGGVHAPFVGRDKAAIVKLGDGLGVPFAQTWSCYQGRARHCGRCGTCVERREAFELAGVADPTEYEGAEPLWEAS